MAGAQLRQATSAWLIPASRGRACPRLEVKQTAPGFIGRELGGSKSVGLRLFEVWVDPKRGPNLSKATWTPLPSYPPQSRKRRQQARSATQGKVGRVDALSPSSPFAAPPSHTPLALAYAEFVSANSARVVSATTRGPRSGTTYAKRTRPIDLVLSREHCD